MKNKDLKNDEKDSYEEDSYDEDEYFDAILSEKGFVHIKNPSFKFIEKQCKNKFNEIDEEFKTLQKKNNNCYNCAYNIIRARADHCNEYPKCQQKNEK
jgi:hypothetical protein